MLKAILFSVITSIFLFINSVLIIKGITTYSAVLTFIVFQMAILNIFHSKELNTPVQNVSYPINISRIN